MRNARCVVPMQIAKWGYVLISALMCALGILLMVRPERAEGVIGAALGILLIAFGVVRLVGYFSRDLYRLAFQYDLGFGVIMIALGVLTLVRPGNLMTFICIVLGTSILADGIFRLQISMEARSFGIRAWWLIAVCAALSGLFGLLLMFRPGAGSEALIILLGVSLLLDGLLNLSTVLTAVKIVRNQRPDIIEGQLDGQFYEKGEE